MPLVAKKKSDGMQVYAKNDPTSLLIDLSKQFPNEFMVSNFKSSSGQCDVHLLSSWEYNRLTGYTLGHGYLLISKLLP